VIELYVYLSQTSLDLKVYFENVENGKHRILNGRTKALLGHNIPSLHSS
jgi:hypothetical protein